MVTVKQPQLAIGSACAKLSAPAHGTKIRGGNLKLLETTAGFAR